jgi:hypothetical protein
LGAVVQQTARADLLLPDPNPGVTTLTFGDFDVYSLAFLNSFFFGEPNPPSGNEPFHVDSPPGAIKDLVVIATGADGKPVNENVPLASFDDAFTTPSGVGGDPFFKPSEPDNGPTTGNPNGLWDAEIAALRTFLTAGGVVDPKLVIFFNLNEDNSGPAELSGQDLLSWLKISVIDDSPGGAATLDFYLTGSGFGGPVPLLDNLDAAGNPGSNGIDDALDLSRLNGFPEADPTIDPDGTGVPDDTADDIRWTRVHGQITIGPDGLFLHFGPVEAGDPAGSEAINQNLGADSAAFGVFSQALNDIVMNAATPYDRIVADLRMSRLDNGYEQLFIMPATIEGPPRVVPEPATMAMWGLGTLVCGVYGWARRRRAKK